MKRRSRNIKRKSRNNKIKRKSRNIKRSRKIYSTKHKRSATFTNNKSDTEKIIDLYAPCGKTAPDVYYKNMYKWLEEEEKNKRVKLNSEEPQSWYNYLFSSSK